MAWSSTAQLYNGHSEDPGGYNKSIQPNDSSFNQSKSKKKHACKVIEYKKFLGLEEKIQTLIIQAVEELIIKALKEDYILYGRRTPFKMLEHL